ncbi:hypothetical protein GCM10010399_94470 [Dactylosporangium fulvum]
MRLFFNDPRVHYVTKHRRVWRLSSSVLVVGGVGALTAAAIGATHLHGPPTADYGPTDNGIALPQRPAIDRSPSLNLAAVPAAPVPVLDLAGPGRTAAPPVSEKKRVVSRPQRPEVTRQSPAATALPVPTETATASPEPTAEPTTEPTPEPTAEPTPEPTADQTRGRRGRPHHDWPWPRWRDGESTA